MMAFLSPLAPRVGNRWCLDGVSSSSETTATPAQRQIDRLTSSARRSDVPGSNAGDAARGDGQARSPKESFGLSTRPPLIPPAWTGSCEKIWLRPRVVSDRRETSGRSVAPGSPSVVRFVPSISSEQPAHNRHNLPASRVWEQLISTSARARSTWRRSRSLSSNRWPILSCVRVQDQARTQ